MNRKRDRKNEKIGALKRGLESIKVEEIAGNLYIKRGRGTCQFYHRVRMEGKIQRHYISIHGMDLARHLAQQTYNRSVERLISTLEKEDLDGDEIDRMVDDQFLALSPERRSLIRPVQKPLLQKLADWKKRTYQGLPFKPEDPLILTYQGKRVRSKTEKILCDRFDQMSIIYKYECPLVLKDGVIFYPDFTFFNPYTEEEIYWEHHGLMGDGDYTMRTIEKIRAYEKNGIGLGRRLLVTFEGGKLNVDYDRVKDLIRDFLLPLVPPGARPRQKKDRQREVL